MFYIKLDEDMNLVITVNEPIYRGDNLKQKITYLIPATINDIDMKAAYVYLNYIRADGTPDVVILERAEEMYNSTYLQYTFPVRCNLTRFAGEVCTWIQIFSGSASAPITAKSSECVLHVLACKNMDDYICDRQVTALYQIQKQLDTGLEEVNESISAVEAIAAAKADNLVFDSENSTIQLTADGEPIGDAVYVCTSTGMSITDIVINEDGELIVTLADGTEMNVGTVVNGSGQVYVPHIDEHKILTFTIEDAAGEIPDPVDLNPNDEWSGIVEDEAGTTTDYVWEDL